VEIWGIQSSRGVESEARIIQELVDSGIDAIVLRPEDPVLSIPALQKANDAGIVVITIDFCFDEGVATGMVFACYNTNGYRMGYDSGTYLVRWAHKELRQKTTNKYLKEGKVKLGLLDSATYDRYYPTFQGFLAAIRQQEAELNLNGTIQIIATTDAVFRAEVDKVVTMLQENPEINVLWGGSNSATEIALEAVKTLKLEDKVAVFGILDLSQRKAKMLLDPTSPLQSMIDQSGVEIGQKAVEQAITLLRREAPIKYKVYPIQHRLLTQEDKDAVRDLLVEVNSIR
jgi:ABC-type sugar transport system substrate-binding protein